MDGQGPADEVLRQHLVPVPAAPVQVQYSEAQVVLRPGEGAGFRVDGQVPEPSPHEGVRVDADLFKKSGRQILFQALAAALLHDGPQHAGAGGVVQEPGPRFVGDGGGKVVGDEIPPHIGHAGHAVGHGQHVLHGDPVHALGGDDAPRFDLVGENIHHPLVQPHQPLARGDADGGGGVALAEGVVAVDQVRSVGGPPALGEHLPVAGGHKAVHGGLVMAEGLEAVQHRPGGDAH